MVWMGGRDLTNVQFLIPNSYPKKTLVLLGCLSRRMRIQNWEIEHLSDATVQRIGEKIGRL